MVSIVSNMLRFFFRSFQRFSALYQYIGLTSYQLSIEMHLTIFLLFSKKEMCSISSSLKSINFKMLNKKI